MLDGFPRSISQVDWLIEQITNGRVKLTVVINLQSSDEVIRDRLIRRGRVDDTHSSIDVRLKEYVQTTLPILKKLKTAGYHVAEVDASQSPETVHSEIVSIINDKSSTN